MRPKLLFVFADDRFFWSHRLSVARAALRHGYEVVLATGVYTSPEHIEAEGFRLIPLKLVRKLDSPFNNIRAVRQLREIYRVEQPDIVHHVALKAVLCGSIARGRRTMPVLNALTGLGYLVASSSPKAGFLRFIIWNAFKVLLNRPNQRILVENHEDKQLVAGKIKVPPENVIVTRGSGVDVNVFQASPEPAGVPVVLLASRMLWIKGIKEFVEAAQLLRSKGIQARFALAGDSDPNNPSCVPRQQLLDWQSSGAIEWWGHHQDMAAVFKQANLVCLPSHGGEGVPKVLMEAAASGRAIVTTNVPGCRDIVRDGVSGLLIESRNVSTLAEAIEKLLRDPDQRAKMGAEGRNIAVAEFSDEAVIKQTLDLYAELLGASAPVPVASGERIPVEK